MSPLDHVDDYPEIPISMASTATALKTGAWRSVRPVLTPRTAPCSAGCPAGVAIPAYLHLITTGRLEEALAVFAAHNPFPRITGRVCPHTCQEVCNLAITTDDGPVSIRSIERWLGDATAHLPHPPPAETTGRRVAVVGSGPAGLSAAYYLRRSGHEVTVLERRDDLGGMLRHAIPEYRLPAEVVEAEVTRLGAMGIEFRTGVSLGDEIPLDDLETEFAAVFLATGADVERSLGIPGQELVHPGLEFLDAASGDRASIPGRRCGVIGGGNTAMDVARVLRRLGAEVTVMYRRTAAEMPAIPEEYERAVTDGVHFDWLAAPRSVAEEGNGLVVEIEEMRLGEPDASGRRRPEPTGRIRPLVFDGVFAAIGETADPAPFPDRLRGPEGWLAVDPHGSTVDPAVLAGGDLVTGPATVVAAIAAGRRAALAIDRMLGFADRWPDEPVEPVVPSGEVNPIRRIRRQMAVDPPAARVDPLAEETVTIAAAAVLEEIERCLSCGHCNECGSCFAFCPDGAIAWEAGPVIDLEYCKGCGICVTECPGRALVLVNEREFAGV
jgi:NADPH-dependent glutamate synthase beta subunit-like oxidoreductase/Pyruvate/2-oxoacid:ferredoxin oxidoreductase delta subunit